MRILHTILALSLVALATNVRAGPVDLTAWPDHEAISGQAGGTGTRNVLRIAAT